MNRQLEDIKEFWQEHALKREGYRSRPYKDSLGKMTVGIGHLVKPGEDFHFGKSYPAEQLFKLFDEDSAPAIEAALKQAEEIGCTTTVFIVALISVNFQLGTKWTAKFPQTYKALVGGRYSDAIRRLYGSKWFAQTPVRVEDFIEAIKRIPKKEKLNG